MYIELQSHTHTKMKKLSVSVWAFFWLLFSANHQSWRYQALFLKPFFSSPVSRQVFRLSPFPTWGIAASILQLSSGAALLRKPSAHPFALVYFRFWILHFPLSQHFTFCWTLPNTFLNLSQRLLLFPSWRPSLMLYYMWSECRRYRWMLWPMLNAQSFIRFYPSEPVTL